MVLAPTVICVIDCTVPVDDECLHVALSYVFYRLEVSSAFHSINVDTSTDNTRNKAIILTNPRASRPKIAFLRFVYISFSYLRCGDCVSERTEKISKSVEARNCEKLKCKKFNYVQ